MEKRGTSGGAEGGSIDRNVEIHHKQETFARREGAVGGNGRRIDDGWLGSVVRYKTIEIME